MLNSNKIFGDWGERKAEEFLIKKGYKIVESNYHKRGGEIDIIASFEGKIHFIEVKTRKISSIKKYGQGEEAVNIFKQKKLIETAYTYLNEKNFPDQTEWQMDIISITYLPEYKTAKIKYIQNAFDENDI